MPIPSNIYIYKFYIYKKLYVHCRLFYNEREKPTAADLLTLLPGYITEIRLFALILCALIQKLKPALATLACLRISPMLQTFLLPMHTTTRRDPQETQLVQTPQEPQHSTIEKETK
jgi:hypothetical protein